MVHDPATKRNESSSSSNSKKKQHPHARVSLEGTINAQPSSSKLSVVLPKERSLETGQEYLRAGTSSPPSSFRDGYSSQGVAVEGSEDEEDDMDWEEVEVATYPTHASADMLGETENGQVPGTIEITLQRATKPQQVKKKGGDNTEALIRLEAHKMHTICLLTNAAIRNKWINDPLLHARLMSITPLALQNAFQAINRTNQPDAGMRGRAFQRALEKLVDWWKDFFEIDELGVQNRPFAEVEAEIARTSRKLERKGKRKSREDKGEGEVIRSSKSLMKHALMGSGSSDTSAQLFTSLCRALDIPARLVVSLQSVPWQTDKPPQSRNKGRTPADTLNEMDRETGNTNSEATPPTFTDKGKGKVMQRFPGPGTTLSGANPPATKLASPVITLRKQRAKGRLLGSTPQRERSPSPPEGGFPPVFWTEVFSRPDGRWIPVDPIRAIVNQRRRFEPPRNYKRNRMVYVVGFEEDGFARDVTPRYAKNFGIRTTKVRASGRKGKKDWWEKVMAFLTRPYRLNRDDVEDAEFQANQLVEGMPSSVGGFKNHPLYALERHLHRDQVIYPKNELGKFRGESVYPRSNVVSLKTAENWMRQGRMVRQGAQALKWVKGRATTAARRMALEMEIAREQELGRGIGDGAGAGMQAMYAEWQTELYQADPVVNGKVPKNDFGNIDLYVPSMLPRGGVHLPHKGIAKIARDLGFDFAEAVTGFEFKKGRGFPILTGIVIASENEEALLEAYWATAQAAEEKERARRQERVIKRWTRLVQGLRIRQRLQEQYTGSANVSRDEDSKEDKHAPVEAGGFLTEMDNLLQPFYLPKAQGAIPEPTAEALEEGNEPEFQRIEPISFPDLVDLAETVDVEDKNVSFHQNDVSAPFERPKTMQELAEAENSRVHSYMEDGVEKEDLVTGLSSPSVPPSTRAAAKGALPPGANGRRPTARSRRAVGDTTKPTPRASNRTTRKRTRKASLTSSESADSAEIEKPKTKRGRGVVGREGVASTRVLRSRVPKSPEKLKQEQDMEDAYRRATEE